VEQEDSSIWNFTIEEMDHGVPWYHATILLIDREEDYTRQTWSWSSLYHQGSGTQSLLSNGGTPGLFCNVTDLSDNGYIDVGDFFTIVPNGTGFDPTSVDELTIMYDPTGNPMWTNELRGGKLVAPTGFPWLVLCLSIVVVIALIAFLLMRKRKGNPAPTTAPKSEATP
jgi:hypothetical protein